MSLERLAAIADDVGAPNIADEARSLAHKTATGRYYVACLGEFKRGKSTLLDALLGEPLLPIGVLPVTSVPTVVCYGDERMARVRTRQGEWKTIDIAHLEQYVAEAENPENVKGITGVEVFLPNKMLAGGMCFVDTPGIGSVFEANTAATEEFVPHIDAALVVVGADPPISGEELALIQRTSGDVADSIFILNKTDRVSSADRAAARDFASGILARRLGRPVEVLEVSAKQKLDGLGDDLDWTRLVSALEQLRAQSGRKLAERSRQSGTDRLVSWLRRDIDEQKTGLQRPIGEMEARLDELNKYIAHARQSLLELSALLTAEEQRLIRTLGEHRRNFLASVLDDARTELDNRCSKDRNPWGPAYRRRCMTAAQDVARELMNPWLHGERLFAAAEYTKVRERFAELANDFLIRLVQSGVRDVAHFEDALTAEAETPNISSFHFHEISRVANPASPFRAIADIVLAGAAQYRVILRGAQRFLEQLVEVNTSRVQREVEDRLSADRNNLENKLSTLFQETRGAAERTLNRVREKKLAGETAVRAEVERLDKLEAELTDLFGAVAPE